MATDSARQHTHFTSTTTIARSQGPDEHFTVLSLSGGKPKKSDVTKSLLIFLGPDFITGASFSVACFVYVHTEWENPQHTPRQHTHMQTHTHANFAHTPTHAHTT